MNIATAHAAPQNLNNQVTTTEQAEQVVEKEERPVEVVTPPKQEEPPKAVEQPKAVEKPIIKPATPKAPVAKATGTKEQWMAQAGIPNSEWKYVDYIVSKESGWNPNAVNKSSGACGLVQSLPCSKLGTNWRNPVHALIWQKNYVKARYGGYAQAYAFWVANHWY